MLWAPLFFRVTIVVVVGITSLRRGTWIDFVPKEWMSDEDKKVLKNPEAANKAAYEKMGREAWERSKAAQPQPNWDQRWKK
jgi:hypothetical protein